MPSPALKQLLLCMMLFGSQQLLANSESTSPDYDVDIEVFDIPGHGELTLQVPDLWNYNFTKTDDSTPPLITFYVLDTEQKEIFQLNMSVFWDDGYSRNVTNLDYIKSMVTQAGKTTLSYSDQTELELQELEGNVGQGYFFDLSDSTAGKGEYRYLTQGALGVGQVLLVFSLFSNDDTGILRKAMMRSLKSARHISRNDV